MTCTNFCSCQLTSVTLSPCAEDEATVSSLKQQALSMSLRYNFVTELTSLIVVQEDQLNRNSSGNFTPGEGDGVAESEDAIDTFGGLSPAGRGGGGIFSSSSQIRPELCFYCVLVTLLGLAYAVASQTCQSGP